MANNNTKAFQPVTQAAYWPGRTVGSADGQRVADNHNFLVTRSGHTLVHQAGAGEAIATDGSWRAFAYYVVRLHPRGVDVAMQLTDTSGTAGYEFRFVLTSSSGSVVSSTANAGSGWLATATPPTTSLWYTDYLLVNCQVRRVSGAGNVTIGDLRIVQAEITADPVTTQSRFYGLDDTQWAGDGAPLDVNTIRYALDTTQTLYTAARKHLVTLCAWTNYGLTPAPTVSLGTAGKSLQDSVSRIAAGLHTGATGRRTYRIFATGRNSLAITATYSMQVRGYADAAFGFTITNAGNTVVARASWPAWDLPFQWAPSSDMAPWQLMAAVVATEFTYLQALTIIEETD